MDSKIYLNCFLIASSTSLLISALYMLFIFLRDERYGDYALEKQIARHELERSHWSQREGKLEEQINQLYCENARLRGILAKPLEDFKPEVTE